MEKLFGLLRNALFMYVVSFMLAFLGATCSQPVVGTPAINLFGMGVFVSIFATAFVNVFTMLGYCWKPDFSFFVIEAIGALCGAVLGMCVA